MARSSKWLTISLGIACGFALGGIFFNLAGCGNRAGGPIAFLGLPDETNRMIQERGLTPDDVTAAVSTFMPTGKHDDYVMFASGGHSGQVLVIGLPSMRQLRTIAVFTPEPWQGYGYGVKETALPDSKQSPMGRAPLSWGDSHHPALSETKGDYDGQFLFINDKANGRIAVIDLHDAETKQILANPVFSNNHGATMVTPNTEYVIEGSQYAVPLGHKYAPMSKYKDEYRGLTTFWKFDRGKGRIDPARSFAVELPPYWQDLADAGKEASDGWIFQNSFNTEMATGGIEEGNPPFEAGCSQRDMDYLHLINWKTAEQVVAAGKFVTINDFRVIPLKTAIAEGYSLSRARTEKPAWRGCLSVRPSHRGFGETRSPRDHLSVRQDQGGHRQKGLRGFGYLRHPYSPL